MDKMYFPLSKLDEFEKEFKTVPVNDDGHTISVDYSEMFVRGTVLKLIADVRYLLTELDTANEWIIIQNETITTLNGQLDTAKQENERLLNHIEKIERAGYV